MEKSPVGNICDFHHLPQWAKDNHYIWTGYRTLTNSYVGCVKTLLFLHNETGNILSHLFGFLVLSGLIYYNHWIAFVGTDMGFWDKAVVDIFLASTAACLGCSSFFHLVICHSEPVCRKWACLDYAGIALLIMGSTFPAVYYGFYCEPFFRGIYLSITTTLALSTIVITSNPKYANSEYRHTRVGLFLALAFSGSLPLSHLFFKDQLAEMISTGCFPSFHLMSVVNFIGTVSYAYRVPERWFPGHFDYFGNSHQVLHVCVVIAALFHYSGVMSLVRFFHSGTYQCPVQ
ncbi:hypothetical protein DSO57_1023647 [Entomophthora muscae]|uniref:Uncharacterized protein n=2 Tax=Entomophthora muscae TaxID=34485 RepID=A0ACC2RHE9_9FUNG|nr:hypothetical protein DSO57_1023647 [Entomophthora muscae]